MKSSKQLAKEMAAIINQENNGFIKGFFQGVISIPVDFYYLGKDFFDTENLSSNNYDRYRMAQLIESGLVNRESLRKIIEIALKEYFNKLSSEQIQNLIKTQAGKIAGSFPVKQYLIAGAADFGSLFSSCFAVKFSISYSIAVFLSLGAMSARAIYTSRDLSLRNQQLYAQLVRLGNLDLLYFLVEEITKPFEEAVLLHSSNRYAFNEVANEFIKLV